MNKMQQQVTEFHLAFNHLISDKPTLVPEDLYVLRFDLIAEELDEYWEACESGDIVAIADALGDLLYVVFGAAVVHGIDLEPIVNEIHHSNMTKLDADGNPIYRADGKILKSALYQPPLLGPIVRAQQGIHPWNDRE